MKKIAVFMLAAATLTIAADEVDYIAEAQAADAQYAFYDLCRTGTPDEVQAAIDSGVNLDERDIGSGWTPLMNAAAGNENPEVIRVLLDAGADIEASDRNGWTPLRHAAVSNENPEVVRELLVHGADFEARDNRGWTPLMNAAQWSRNPGTCRVLIEAGADPNIHEGIPYGERSGNTPLMLAVINGTSPEMVRVLIESGADLEARNRTEATALILAARYNSNTKIVRVLLDAGADIRSCDFNGKTAYDFAQSNGAFLRDPDALELLKP
jgi:ankyrin repeat protein